MHARSTAAGPDATPPHATPPHATPPDAIPGRATRAGLGYGLAAYLLWGLFPLYLKALGRVGAGEVLAHRIVWSLLLVAVLVLVLRRGAAIAAVLRRPRVLAVLALTAVLIAGNWLVYIHAVTTGRLLSASLGYYLNPLVSVALGVVVLRERLRPAQVGAMLLAAAGIAALAVGAGGSLWITVTLAASFATYGLLRKMAPADPLTGLGVETALLAPIAGAYLLWLGSAGSFGDDGRTDLLLLLSGAATAVPLLLFSAAAKRLRYSSIGVLQFLAPSIQFALAVWVFGEPLTRAHIVCFAAIWVAVAIWVADAWRGARPPAAYEAAG